MAFFLTDEVPVITACSNCLRENVKLKRISYKGESIVTCIACRRLLQQKIAAEDDSVATSRKPRVESTVYAEDVAEKYTASVWSVAAGPGDPAMALREMCSQISKYLESVYSQWGVRVTRKRPLMQITVKTSPAVEYQCGAMAFCEIRKWLMTFMRGMPHDKLLSAKYEVSSFVPQEK